MTLLIGLLVGVSVWVWLIPVQDAGPRVRRLFLGRPQERTSSPLLVPIALIAFGIGMTVLLGSVLGLVLGIAAAAAFPRVMARLDGRAQRERTRRVADQAGDTAALLAAVLASGSSLTRAIAVVASASDEPIAGVLRTVASALDLGAGPEEAWLLADPDGVLDDIASGFRRSARSGAPLSEILTGVAADLHRRRRQSMQIAARVAGVRAIAPLAVCFLPAFLLVGAVPIIASFANGLFAP